MTYVLTIPRIPPSLNDFIRMGRPQQERERRAFERDVAALLCEKNNKCPQPLQTPVHLRAVVMRPGISRSDSDNQVLVYKWLQDVLVLKGFLPDDTPEYVTHQGARVMRGEKPLTIVTIEEAA